MTDVLFNCTTNCEGGALANAANFISESIQRPQSVRYHYVVSQQVYDLVAKYVESTDQFTVFTESPAKSLRARYRLSSLEKIIQPRLVFTMAGPAYVSFKSPHLMGCSNPYIIYANIADIQFGRGKIESIFRVLHTIYQALHMMKADYYLFQTESSRKQFLNRYKLKTVSFVVSNSLGLKRKNVLDNGKVVSNLHLGQPITILFPSKNYPHKGMHVINALCGILDKRGRSFRFLITESEIKSTRNYHSSGMSRGSNMARHSKVEYIGSTSYDKMPELYAQCDIVFMPSVLEVFSSVCLESLHYRKPLVVADRSFNREIAGQYATYCNPFNLESCADSLIEATRLLGNDDYLDEAQRYIDEKYGSYERRFHDLNALLSIIIAQH